MSNPDVRPCIFMIFLVLTTKRIRDRTIISSIKPKFEYRFFVDLIVLYKMKTRNVLACELFCQFCQFCKLKQFYVRDLYITHKSTKNWRELVRSVLYSFSCNLSISMLNSLFSVYPKKR